MQMSMNNTKIHQLHLIIHSMNICEFLFQVRLYTTYSRSKSPEVPIAAVQQHSDWEGKPAVSVWFDKYYI